MKLSKNFKVSLLFLGMLFCHIVLPYAMPFLADMSYYSLLLMSQILLQLPVVIYLAVRGENPFKLISFKLFNPIVIILLILMTYCVLPLTALLNLISQLFVSNAMTDLTLNTMEGSLLVNLAFIALLPALSEEFAFRGVVFHSLKKSGGWFAIILSALFFGMMHLNLNQFFYTFAIGIAMALAVEATGSIWGSVVVHFTLNGNSVILMKLFSSLFSSDELNKIMAAEESSAAGSSDILMMIPVVAVFAVIMLIPAGCFLFASAKICGHMDRVSGLFGIRCKGTDENEENKEEDSPKRKKILDVFFVLCLLIAFGYMIIFPV